MTENQAPAVLVVDDDPNICEVLRLYLSRDGFAVTIADDGQAALEAVESRAPDLVILDIMLPTLRERSNVPVIMLTALGESTDRVAGLELGADDYMVKPFDPNELVARVRAVLRRTRGSRFAQAHGHGASTTIVVGNLSIWPEQYRVDLQGKRVELAPKEFELLHHLARHPNQVFTRDQLLEAIWGYDYLGESRTVDVHIQRLRKKLGLSDTHSPDRSWDITTVWGVGYKLEVNDR